MGLSKVTLLVEAVLNGNEGKQRKFGLVPKVFQRQQQKLFLEEWPGFGRLRNAGQSRISEITMDLKISNLV